MKVHDLQAPEENGGLLAHPPLEQAGRLLKDNRRHLDALAVEVLGQSLQSLRLAARRDVLHAAQTYLAAAGEPVPAPSDGPLLLAGHQPELFHPGVWIKNFALSGLARRQGGLALNLVVDNDTAKNTVLRVPSGGHVAQIPFDHWQSEVPFEERAVIDEELFRCLPETAAGLMDGWSFKPLLSDFWAQACHQGERTPLLGERFAAARRAYERAWGCTNLEVPVSLVCQTETFAWFACDVLDNLGRFHEVYNGVVQAYRRQYHMRSRHHPVPDLAKEGDWFEAPLWAWRAGQKRRVRLLSRRSSKGLELRAGAEEWPTLRETSRPEEIVAQWRSLEGRGYKVRTRALTTTLFARLFVGDIFLHGLGGGKYDELTDDIMGRYYHVEPPAFLVLSGTLLLPLPQANVSVDDYHRLHTLERDLRWNPQRHLRDGAAGARALSEEKANWIRRVSTKPGEGQERYEMLRELTHVLQPFVKDEEEETRRRLEQATRELAIRQVRERRDYAFCLYPEEALRSFCRQFL